MKTSTLKFPKPITALKDALTNTLVICLRCHQMYREEDVSACFTCGTSLCDRCATNKALHHLGVCLCDEVVPVVFSPAVQSAR